MFVLPWEELSYIGTTDTDADSSPDALRVTAGDVTYLLRSANAAFPMRTSARMTLCRRGWGCVPCCARIMQIRRSVSREHRVLESPHGLISTPAAS